MTFLKAAAEAASFSAAWLVARWALGHAELDTADAFAIVPACVYVFFDAACSRRRTSVAA